MFKNLLLALLLLTSTPVLAAPFQGTNPFNSGSGTGGSGSSSLVSATGTGTIPRTLADHFADVKNAADFGVVCDGTSLEDVSITTGTSTLSSAGYHFTSADVGKTIVVSNSAQTQGLTTTIASLSGNNAVLTSGWGGNATVTTYGRATFYTTDNTTALATALTSFGQPNSAGYNQLGFRLNIPNGVCATGALTLPRLAILQSADSWNGATLFLKSGVNTDLIRTEGFATNTGTGNYYAQTASVPSWLGLQDIHLDGNKIGQTAGSCFSGYGNMQMMLGSVLIENCHDNCMYTEANNTIANPQGTDWKAQTEGVFQNVKTRNCGTAGASGPAATVTITIATPGVITWTAHGLVPYQAVYFTNSGGALPTGITASTPYYVLGGASLTANTFEIATSVANAYAGTAINTTGSQSGTQTGTAAQSCASNHKGCGWLDRGPTDAFISNFIDAQSVSTGYRNEVSGSLYSGGSHANKIHAYDEGDGTAIYIGAGGTYDEIYADFGNFELASSNTKISSIYTTAAGWNSLDAIIIDSTASYFNIGQINLQMYSSAAGNNGVHIFAGAQNGFANITGTSVNPSGTVDLVKSEGGFNQLNLNLSNATGTNSDCLYMAGAYNVINFTGFNCFNSIDFGGDGGNQILHGAIFKGTGTNYNSGGPAATDIVDVVTDSGTNIVQNQGAGGVWGGIPASAGAVGEILTSGGANTTATVTITNASPGVITWTAHGLKAYQAVNFTTTGGLPTGLTVGTNYYVLSGASLTTNTFEVATSIANAVAGTAVNTSSAGSGVQTGISTAVLATGSPKDIAGLSLTAGDWDVRGTICYVANAATTATIFDGSINGTTNTLATPPGNGAYFQEALAVAAGATEPCYSVGPTKISLSSTTTEFLNAQATFATNTMSSYGYFQARRVR